MKNAEHTLIAGLTGQTGAGKSTVAKIFLQHEFMLIDADKISRQVVEPGLPCLEKIFHFFGDSVKNPDKTLNRKALAKIVFNDKQQLENLNAICYPFIIKEISNQIQAFSAQNQKFILLDAPTLFESGASDFCDVIISVIANASIRCERIMLRDNLTRQAAHERMNAQLDEQFFIQHSDYLIHNNGNFAELSALSADVAEKIKLFL